MPGPVRHRRRSRVPITPLPAASTPSEPPERNPLDTQYSLDGYTLPPDYALGFLGGDDKAHERQPGQPGR